MSAENNQNPDKKQSREQAIIKRINAIGWALFFIMIGCLWMVPMESVPESTWLIGAGVIMLGTNFFRYINGIKVVGFTIFIGILALATGITAILGIEIPVFPILIILIGLHIIFGHIFEK